MLGEKKEWKPVLRKLGCMLFGVSPEEKDANFDETHKVCVNAGHFLNSYLCVNKSAGKRAGGMPSIPTCRGFQRSATILMSGFLFAAFDMAKPEEKITQLHKYMGAKHICGRIMEADKDNALSGLGYDICLRNWIFDTKSCLQLYKPKGRRKSQQDDGTLEVFAKLMERCDSLEKRMRIMEAKVKDDDDNKRSSEEDNDNKDDEDDDDDCSELFKC